MEKVAVDWEELNNLLFFLVESIEPEVVRVEACFAIREFLERAERKNYYHGIDVVSLENRALLFNDTYHPTILQVEADKYDAVLSIYQGDEKTYGDFNHLELYRMPFATELEFNLLELIKKKIEKIKINPIKIYTLREK